MFHLAYNTTIQFGVKKIPDYKKDSIYNIQMNNFEYMCNLLKQLSSRELTGDKAKFSISYFLESVSEATAEVFIRIIKKDLRCNTGKPLANKVWKGLIPVTLGWVLAL